MHPITAPSTPSGISFLKQIFLFPTPLHLRVMLLSPVPCYPACLLPGEGRGSVVPAPSLMLLLQVSLNHELHAFCQHHAKGWDLQFWKSLGLVCKTERRGELRFILQGGHICKFKLCFPRLCTFLYLEF